MHFMHWVTKMHPNPFLFCILDDVNDVTPNCLCICFCTSQVMSGAQKQYLKCRLCSELSIRPVRPHGTVVDSQCIAIMCHDCYLEWWIKNHEPKCPLCYCSISSTVVTPDTERDATTGATSRSHSLAHFGRRLHKMQTL